MVEIKDLGSHVGETVTVAGWVETTRSHGKVAFAVLRDGTGLAQCVLVKKQVDEATWEAHALATQESVVSVKGEVRADDRAPGGYEIGVSELKVLGPAEEYPIQPKEHGVDFLLDHRHLWLRSSQQRAGLRVRAEVEQAIHDFFYGRGFVRIDRGRIADVGPVHQPHPTSALAIDRADVALRRRRIRAVVLADQ